MDILGFAFELLVEHFNWNEMRLERRTIRDHQNAFEIPELQFTKMFRLSKNLTFYLIQEIQGFAQPAVRNTAIPFHLKTLATLNFFASGSFQGGVGNSSWNCLSQPVISRSITEVSRLITEHLLDTWIQFPNTNVRKNLVKQTFFQKWGIRGTIGAIDGTHVEIMAPPQNDLEHPPFVYINRKGKHSINVMCIADADLKILAIDARYPGSVHDAAIFRVSDIRNHLITEYEQGDRNSHLIGDSGYGVEPWLFTPFQNVQPNTPQERYNQQLCSARNVVERTFGVLKKRFACLSRHRVLLYHPSKAAYIIYACAVCHNIALTENLELDILDNDEDDEPLENMEENIQHNFNITNLGMQARNQYVHNNFF